MTIVIYKHKEDLKYKYLAVDTDTDCQGTLSKTMGEAVRSIKPGLFYAGDLSPFYKVAEYPSGKVWLRNKNQYKLVDFSAFECSLWYESKEYAEQSGTVCLDDWTQGDLFMTDKYKGYITSDEVTNTYPNTTRVYTDGNVFVGYNPSTNQVTSPNNSLLHLLATYSLKDGNELTKLIPNFFKPVDTLPTDTLQ